MKGPYVLLVAMGLFLQAHSQDTVRVQFIYGSRPLKKYKDNEKRWFGGILGGHVGIEGDSGKFYSFELRGKVKVFNSKKINSVYKTGSEEEFWNVMKTKEDSLKKATIVIPITRHQKQIFDSLTSVYIKNVPYGYAFFGMRCGASTYEILSQMEIVPRYSHFKTFMKIFYPRRLRKRLLTKAEANNWTVIKKEGTPKRRWERDVNFGLRK